MAEEKKEKKETASTPAAPAPTAAAAAAAQPAKLSLNVDHAKTTYANLARATGTPEEVILDLALNPNAFGQVLDEEIGVDHRIVMSYPTAKRLLLIMSEIVRRYENRFGVIETDVTRRMRS